MFRSIARRIPRFGLPTLIATMLLVVSVGGATRIGFGPDYEEAKALRSLENEGLGYTAPRAYSGETDSASLSADAWNPFRRFAQWALGQEDRIHAAHIFGWPTAETRETLFELPHVYELMMDPSVVELPTYGADRIPTPEEILGGPLPKLDGEGVPADLPRVPAGIPLADDERDDILREMRNRSGIHPPHRGERYLCRADSTDLPGFTLLTASDGESSWQLRYRQAGSKASAKTSLRTPELRVSRVREEEGWATYYGLRTADDALDASVDPSIAFVWPSTHVTRSVWLDGDPDEAFESVERLEDGTVAFRLRPRALEAPSPSREPVSLLEGVLVVDPQKDYVVVRYDAIEENRFPGTKTGVRFAFAYERFGSALLPVRSIASTDLPPYPIEDRTIPGGPRVAVVRYAWDFDPDFSPSLFEPPKGNGDFFAAAPSTGRFQWWYVTGAIALGWLYFLVSRGILRRIRRAKPQKGPHEESPIAIADSAEAS